MNKKEIIPTFITLIIVFISFYGITQAFKYSMTKCHNSSINDQQYKNCLGI